MRVDGGKLRRAREHRALTMREVAELARIDHKTVWRLENGATDTVRPPTVRKLAAALGVEPAELIATDDPPPNA